LTNSSHKERAYIALGIVSFFWGTTWLASKIGVRYMGAIQMTGLRQFIGGSIYVLFFLFKGYSFPKGKQWIPVLVLTLLNFILSNTLSTWAMKFIPSGLGAIIGGIFPLWVVLFTLMIKRSEKIGWKVILGVVLGFSGICIIFYHHLHDFLNPDFRFGIFLLITSTITWAMGTLYTVKQSVKFNPYFNLGLQMLISGVLLYGVSHLKGEAVSITAIPWQSWLAIAYLVFFGSVISFVAYIYSLQHLPTSLVSVYAYINPVIAVLLGSLLNREPLNLLIAVGAIVTINGIYLVNRGVAEQGRR
jgi:drug/metabolite transporter (DMT)-like permease